MFTFWQKIEFSLFALVPGAILLLLVLLVSLPMPVSGLAEVMPLLPYAPLFYWGIFQPRNLPYWFLFLAGALRDTLSGTPLGFSSLMFMGFRFLLMSQRRLVAKEGFPGLWLCFTAIMLVTVLSAWTLMSLIHLRFFPLGTSAVQWLLTIGLYPVLHNAFHALHHGISRQVLLSLHKK